MMNGELGPGDEVVRVENDDRGPLPRTNWRCRRASWAVASLAVLGLAGFFPEATPPPPVLPGGRPFAWRQDELWQGLQARFEADRALGCDAVEDESRRGLARAREVIVAAGAPGLPSDAPVFAELEKTVFDLGPLVAACPGHLSEFASLVTRARAVVKSRAQDWDLGSADVRDRMYRLLYGGRAALEEAMLQAAPNAIPALMVGENEPSITPAANVLGVTVHSGDILVSRGGAPTSALIARGNDYPGNFSHIALLHVGGGGKVSIVEAHIERGVAIASVEGYLRDVKLRVMVLRLRADLPLMQRDPMLPHRAASRALEEARRHHIPYNFAMDTADRERLFCSEVASTFYREQGIGLWMGLSTISSPGLASWLAGFGVRHFVTQEPSDLEYDPQLRVVAEWRDPEVLFKDHVDNAVIDALLEVAERGGRLGYPMGQLPVARLAKLYSVVLNAFGRIGPVPEGMSPAAALRSRRLIALHAGLAEQVMEMAVDFQSRHEYRPPYWELLRLAREACAETRCEDAL